MEKNLLIINIYKEQSNNKESINVSSQYNKNKELLIKLLKDSLDASIIKLEKRNKIHLSIIKLTGEEIKNITNWSINANKQIKNKLKKDKEKEKLSSLSKKKKSKKKEISSYSKAKTPIKGRNFKTFILEESKSKINSNKTANKSVFNLKDRKSLKIRIKSLPNLKKIKNNLDYTVSNIKAIDGDLSGRLSLRSNKSMKSNKISLVNKGQKVKNKNLKANNKNTIPVRRKTPLKKIKNPSRNRNDIYKCKNLTNLNKKNYFKTENIEKTEQKHDEQNNKMYRMNRMESALRKIDLLNDNDPLLISPITDFYFNKSGKLSTSINENNNIEKIHIFKFDFEKNINDKLYSVISNYLSIYDLIQLKNVSKYFNKLFNIYIVNSLEKDKMYFINEKNNLNLDDIAPILSIKDLVLSKGSIKAIQLLKDPYCNLLFSEKSEANKDRIIIFRTFFQLINNPLKFIPKEKEDEFWQKCQNYFCKEKENNGNIGELVQKIIDGNMIDIGGNNLYKIYKLVYKDLDKINPKYYSTFCGTTGLFTFFIKDILDFVGITNDIKFLSNSYWTFSKIIESIEKKIIYIKQLKHI